MFRRSLRYVEELSEGLKNQLALAYSAKDLLGWGLRARLAEGYTRKDFRADLTAAVVVGAVALPLSIALAVAAGVAPEHGLYTAIIAGIVCSLLGGSRFQVTGPTAAFVVILLPITHRYGIGGLLVAGMMAGAILVLMGLARLGKLIQFVPHPVTTGLTMGIALTLGLLLLKDALGVVPCTGSLTTDCLAKTEGTIEYLGALVAARGGINPWDVGIALLTIALLLIVPRVLKRIPAPLVALVIVSVVVVVLQRLVPGFHAATIASTFHFDLGGGQTGNGIPPLPPLPVVPWHVTDGIHAALHFDYNTLRELAPSAFAIAMLGAIESLNAATVGDALSNTRHEPNSELIALGISNILCPLFGGIAATGALARTATNIRAGARSPFASALHAVVVLACTIALAPLAGYLPMAALAGLLVIVARNLSEARHFFRLTRIAPTHDVIVMLTCFTLTVLFDMVIAVTVGVVLAALLFMRQMAVATKVDLETPAEVGMDVPAGVRVYQIAGPMFFGAAKTAMEALHAVGASKDHTYIIDMKDVPTMDATGLVALESAIDTLHRAKIKIIFAGLQPEVSRTFDRAGLKRDVGKLGYAPNVETAISMAIVHAARSGELRISRPIEIPPLPPADQSRPEKPIT